MRPSVFLPEIMAVIGCNTAYVQLLREVYELPVYLLLRLKPVVLNLEIKIPGPEDVLIPEG